MQALGLSVTFMQTIKGRPTGTATVEVGPDCEPVFTIHRPSAFDAVELSPLAITQIEAFAPDWVYMGTLLQTDPEMEKLIRNLLQRLPHTRCFYDMNLRGGHWNLSLVERLCTLASILKLKKRSQNPLHTKRNVLRAVFS